VNASDSDEARRRRAVALEPWSGPVTADTILDRLRRAGLGQHDKLLQSGIVSLRTDESEWVFVQTPCPNDCGAHGSCQSDLSCQCTDGFSGADCGIAPAFFRCPNDCNNNGLCVQGECVCETGWHGDDCGELRRACPGNCGSDPLRGTCNTTTGACACTTLYGGDDCGERLCLQGCGENGVCISGLCVCDSGYTGATCGERLCLQQCGEGGTCVDGTCECRKGWNGELCDANGCPRDCSNHGQCIRDGDGDLKHDGDDASAPWQCLCDLGFRGDYCQARLELNCADGVDNDDDGVADCDDADCCAQEICASDDSCKTTPSLMDLVPAEDLEVPKDEGSRSFFETIAFMINGTNPTQLNTTIDAFDRERIAVARGKVTDRQNIPLPGVTVAIAGSPELGYTLTRADGTYDLLVHGGGNANVEFRRRNYIASSRTPFLVEQTSNDVQQVALLPVSKISTKVELSGANGNPEVVQVAAGEMSQDVAGNRTARMMFQGNNEAKVVFSNGTEMMVEAPTIRVTEYTVGETGPEAMPSELPNLSGYTYAVEVSLDEATVDETSDVVFGLGVPFYVENNLGFPVGSAVPVGAFSRQAGNWRPEANGRVIEIVDKVMIDGKLTAVLEMRANLSYLDPPTPDCNLNMDSDGEDPDVTDAGESAAPDRDENGLELVSLEELEARMNITLREKQELAKLYDVGTQLWRVLMPHATPWDCNWPYGESGPSRACPS
jgi:hypothetical protein